MAENTLVALVPGDVPAQQAKLAAWCTAKVATLTAERSDLLDSARVAKSNQWSFLNLERAAARVARRVIYYEKIKAACEAGYLVIPNFDVEVMAVRITRPVHRVTQTFEGAKVTVAAPDLGPAGEGMYVDDKRPYTDESYQTPDPLKAGQMKDHALYISDGTDDEIDFPVLGVKPIIMEATARAMALRIFDRIGVVTGAKEDPLVVGQIIDPRCHHLYLVKPDRMVSFFVAWWLDPNRL
jgi:hypothetical protein